LSAEIVDGAIHLGTEDEAWELLRRLVDGEIELESLPKLTLGEWAKIDVYVAEERYDSAITPYMMQGWVDLQRSIYRAYALAVSGKPDGKKLSDADKDQLELIVEVKSGSSDQTVDIQELLTKLGLAMVEKMEPVHALIALTVVALTWGGTTVTKAWLQSRKEVKLAEIEQLKSESAIKAQIAALEKIAEVAGVDRDRVKLLTDARAVVPVIADIEDEANKGREALVHHVTKQDAVVNGVPVSAEAGQSITRKTRLEASDVRLDGLYKIRKVDTTVATGFRVHLADPTGKELVGDVAEVMTTLEDRKVIRDAEWDKTPVFLQITAKERRGVYADAVIVSARKYDPETDGGWT
jgi:hypothetical protein